MNFTEIVIKHIWLKWWIFQLEMRKMVLDRMVNLLCSGCVVPVVKYIKQCWQRGDTDISLIRYFVTEVSMTELRNYIWIFNFQLIGARSNRTTVQFRICPFIYANGRERWNYWNYERRWWKWSCFWIYW